MRIPGIISIAATAAVLAVPCVRSTAAPERTIRVWVFFEREAGPAGTPEVSARALVRTARRGAPDPPPLAPPAAEAVERIVPHVASIRHRSSYFNAVSAEVLPSRIASLRRTPGVAAVRPVATFRRAKVDAVPAPADPGPCRTPAAPGAADPYGPSFNQLAMIEAVDLLEAGYNGSGTTGPGGRVLIGVLDSGFRLAHAALAHVDVLAQYDFIQGDTVTSNEPGDNTQQDRHGTLVLGTIAGRYEGYLAGPAWGARYLLAKTELVGDEIEIEEDNWVAGLEWCDLLGAEIVTSSLGYIDWYAPDSLDGNTALCTRAADMAAARGIVVCNSVGNYGWGGATSLIAPADGDSVIAVGGVYADGALWPSSSRGPTADGRIKPDLAAQSVGVVSVRWPDETGFAGYSGTSFSAPLVAGLCAQLLEVHPEWTPMQLLDSLRTHATRADSPDNGYGWGIPRGFATAGFVRPESSSPLSVSDAYPNPFGEAVRFEIRAERLVRVTARVFDARGALVRRLALDELFILDDVVEWDGRDDDGREVAAGVYFVEFSAESMRRALTVVRLR